MTIAEHIHKTENDLFQWKLAALTCGIYRADEPHSTPAEWQRSQIKALTALLNELVALREQVHQLTK